MVKGATGLLISNINKIPVISNFSDGFWRRFKIIHFPTKKLSLKTKMHVPRVKASALSFPGHLQLDNRGS